MKISVLIPVYNAAPFLRETLRCALEQSLPAHEIIALNDGSQDESGKILSEYGQIRVIDVAHEGISKARNRLLSEAEGDWIAFLDADDLWEPDKLEKQAAYVREHPECQLVFSAVDTFMDPSVKNPSSRQMEMMEANYPYLLQAGFIRKDLFERLGGFREDYSYFEDTDWLMRVSRAGVFLHKLPEILCHYRIHGNNSMLYADMRRKNYMKMLAAAARARRLSGKEGEDLRGSEVFQFKRKPKEQESENVAEKSTLSVIIPAYNGERYLREAITSVTQQKLPSEFSNLEILVVDDGSTDGTVALAESLPGVRCLRCEHRSAGAARNSGICESSGKFLMFLDADDVLREDAVMSLFQTFGENTNLTAVFGMAEDFFSPELSERERSGLRLREGSYRGFFSGCILVRREVFSTECVGLFNESLLSGETVDWLLRFRDVHSGSKEKDWKECPFITVSRRIHKSNTGRLHADQERMHYAGLLRRRLRNKS